jgi:hypothetical protein
MADEDEKCPAACYIDAHLSLMGGIAYVMNVETAAERARTYGG